VSINAGADVAAANATPASGATAGIAAGIAAGRAGLGERGQTMVLGAVPGAVLDAVPGARLSRAEALAAAHAVHAPQAAAATALAGVAFSGDLAGDCGVPMVLMAVRDRVSAAAWVCPVCDESNAGTREICAACRVGRE